MQTRTKLGFAVTAVIVAIGSASAAEGSIVRYSVDLAETDYFHAPADSGQLLFTLTDSAAAGGLIVNFGWDDVEVFVNDNTGDGAPFVNWASELLLGYTWGEYSGIEYAAPFSGVNQDGQHGPVSAENQHWVGDTINSDGTIELWVRSSWNDSTGLPAGTLLGGTLWIDVETTAAPAPAGLALLALAGVIGRRRCRA